MIYPVESIIDGTWSGAESPPQEWTDFQLMRAARWSWEEFKATPEYVKRYFYDFLALEAKQVEQRRAEGDRGETVTMAGHRRIRERRQ